MPVKWTRPRPPLPPPPEPPVKPPAPPSPVTAARLVEAAIREHLAAEHGGGGDLHATSHQHGGDDEVATATPGVNAIPKAGAGGTLATGWIPDLSASYDPAGAAAAAVATHEAALNPHPTYLTQAEGDAIYAPIAKGVTGGDSHDHSGGDGAQINHTTLSNIGTNTHAQIDTHIAAANPHSGSAPNDPVFIVGSAHAGLSAERVVTDTATVAWDQGTAAQLKANVPDDSITYAKLQNASAGFVMLGKAETGSGDHAEIAVGTDALLARVGSGNIASLGASADTALVRQGGSLGFAAIDLSRAIVTGDLPFSKVAQLPGHNVACNPTNALADIQGLEIDADQILGRIGSADLSGIDCSSTGRSIIAAASAAAALTVLGILRATQAANLPLVGATLVNTDLTFTLAANVAYLVITVVEYQVVAVDDFKYNYTVTGTALLGFLNSSQTNVTRLTQAATQNLATDNTVQQIMHLGVCSGGGSGGVLTFQAAKQADGGADGTLYQGGAMVAIPLN